MKAVKIKTSIKAGGIRANHNQTVRGLKVVSNIKAGGTKINHNQTATKIAIA